MRKTDRERTPERWRELLDERNRELRREGYSNNGLNRRLLTSERLRHVAEDKLAETEDRFGVLETLVTETDASHAQVQRREYQGQGEVAALERMIDKLLEAIAKGHADA